VPSAAAEKQILGRRVGAPPYHNIQEVEIMSLVYEGLYACAASAASCCVLYSAAAYSVETHVSIDNFAFRTDTISVPVGSTVVWENRDDTPHNVVAVAGGFRSPALDTEDKFRLKFNAAGTFDYFCSLHSFMKGRVIVTP
jgi:amicyanin